MKNIEMLARKFRKAIDMACEYNVTDVSPFKIVLVAHVSQNGVFE